MLELLGAIITLAFAAGALKDRWPVNWLLKRLVAQPASEVMQREIAGSPTAVAVDAILRELHPNGGSSLRDAVNRTEVKADETARQVAAIERRQRRQQSQLRAVNNRLHEIGA